MKTDTTYNGYTNYETWNVMLWLYNDESIYTELRSSLQPYRGCGIETEDVAYVVRRIFHDGETSATPDGVWLDDKRIDWRQIRKNLVSDLGLNEPK
jgi:hypothetical protein